MNYRRRRAAPRSSSHAEELRPLENAYGDRTEALAAASAAHQARAERAEAEADRLRGELTAARAETKAPKLTG